MNLRTQIAQTNQLLYALQIASEASAGTQGVLHVADGAFKGSLYFESGRIVGAEVKGKDIASIKALQEIIAHKEATFLYDDCIMPLCVKRISFAFQELFKDGFKLVEKEEPQDPLVKGQSVDSASMKTLTTPIKAIDPTMFDKYKTEDE